MKGLDLSRQYYEQAGRAMLEAWFPQLLPRMAIGLAGDGSECFGFDDALSRDHDWGPAFCIWMEEEDYLRLGPQVQAAYDSLPGAWGGFPARKSDPHAGGRVGCLSTPMWYRRYTGCPEGPETNVQWRRIPEAFLAAATNGAVFYDPLGRFSAVRQRLQAFYPEDVRVKKIAARAAVMAQAGQYNYPRCQKRGDMVAAQLALSEFMRAAMSMAYLLNRRYAPFYKWMHRGLRDMERLPGISARLEQLSRTAPASDTVEQIEGICLDMIGELKRQGLTDRGDPFLLDHCGEMMGRIQDPALRRSHIMEE